MAKPGPKPKAPPIPVPAGFKFCFHCRTAKPCADFATDRRAGDRLKHVCRSCDAERRRSYRLSTEAPRRRAESAAKATRGSIFSRMKADPRTSLGTGPNLICRSPPIPVPPLSQPSAATAYMTLSPPELGGSRWLAARAPIARCTLSGLSRFPAQATRRP